MEKTPEVVPRIQGTPKPPHHHHHRGTVTHLNPEGGSLQTAPTVGRGNPYTGKTGKYSVRTPGKRGNCSGGADTTDGTGGRTIGYDGRTLEVMAHRGNQVKRPRKETLRQTGEYNNISVLGWTNPVCIGMDNDGTHT